MSDSLELKERAKAPNGKTFRVKIKDGIAYVYWGTWKNAGPARDGGDAITQAEAFLKPREPKKK